MVKPNVSYVKETNEVHYNPRFTIAFQSGNYYVDEANYLKEIHDSLYNEYPSNDYYYINRYGDVTTGRYNYETGEGDEYVKNIQNEPYFNYIKNVVAYNCRFENSTGKYITLGDNYFYLVSRMISYEDGYCSEQAE